MEKQKKKKSHLDMKGDFRVKFIYDFTYGLQVATFYHCNLVSAKIREISHYEAQVIITIVRHYDTPQEFVYKKPFRWYNSDGSKKCRNALYKYGSTLLKEICEEIFS